jgi:hypothetical protein
MLGQVIRIDILPDDVLLGIFDFYVDMSPSYVKRDVERWQSLVHVCRRWRDLVLGSPRCLNLKLYCTPETPAKDTLDVWPALPLIVEGNMDPSSSTDNIIVALGRSNHVYRVNLWDLAGWQLEEVLAAMQVPFPELTDLHLASNGETMPVIPYSFLDGSAPRLRDFQLEGIPFPGLPKHILSANHLVQLWLNKIPHSGYFSPEAIVALISVLSSLERLSLQFQSPQSRPDRETRRPPPKRSVIHALRYFHFKGVTEYLEDIVTDIDTPQLDDMQITFFNQIDFDTQRLAQFINRTPKLGKRGATVQFDDDCARVALSTGILEIAISCRESDWQLSSIEQVCNSTLHPLSTVEHLYIEHRYSKLVWKDDAIENTLWLQLLLPFTAVKRLIVYKEFAPGIAAALHELVEGRITEVLPSLEKIFVEALGPSGPFREKIGQFIAARQLSNQPIAIIAIFDGDKNSGYPLGKPRFFLSSIFPAVENAT